MNPSATSPSRPPGTLDFPHMTIETLAPLVRPVLGSFGLVFRLLVSVVAIVSLWAVLPGGPESPFAAVAVATSALGIDLGRSLEPVQMWLQVRADAITSLAVWGVAFFAWLGVAQVYRARDNFLAPALVLSCALAVFPSGAANWGVVTVFGLGLIAGGVLKVRSGDGEAIAAFGEDVLVAVFWVGFVALALLSGGRPRSLETPSMAEREKIEHVARPFALTVTARRDENR